MFFMVDKNIASYADDNTAYSVGKSQYAKDKIAKGNS